MADIAWSAYALAMFTPEERAAAAAVTYVPDEINRPLPPPPPRAPELAQGAIVDGLNANNPDEAAELFRRGWRYEAGRWIRSGSLGQPADPDGVRGRIGLSSIPPATFIPGGSLLGYTIPAAPAAILPEYVGGRLGQVVIGAGMRPNSIGQSADERIVLGTGYRVVID